MLRRISKLLKMQPPIYSDPGLLFASGITVPTNTTAGYQTGCIFQHTDGSAGTSLYINEGTYASCAFVPQGSDTTEISVTPGTVAASKAVIVDAYKTLRWGGFNTSAALTLAVPFSTVPEIAADGQRDILAVFGGTGADLTGLVSAKCGRYRHVVNFSGTENAEVYGLVGQLVAKTVVLGLYSAGLMGTIESNGGFHAGQGTSASYSCHAGVIGRPGGASVVVNSSSVLAGLAALSNTSSITATAGPYVGLYVARCASTNDSFTVGVKIAAGAATVGIEVGSVPTGLTTPSVAFGVWGTPLVDATAGASTVVLSVIGSTATNKTSAGDTSAAALFHHANTAATTNTQVAGIVSTVSLGFNCWDAYGIQGHITIGSGGVSTQVANAHVTGLSGKAVLTGACTQGWVTGVLAIIEGAGATGGICNVIAAQVEATATANTVDSILRLGADADVVAAIELAGVAHMPLLLSINDSAGCVGTLTGLTTTSGGKSIAIKVGNTNYYIPCLTASS